MDTGFTTRRRRSGQQATALPDAGGPSGLPDWWRARPGAPLLPASSSSSQSSLPGTYWASASPSLVSAISDIWIQE